MVFWLRIRICPRSESASYSLYCCHSHISGLYTAIESHSSSFSSLSFSSVTSCNSTVRRCFSAVITLKYSSFFSLSISSVISTVLLQLASDAFPKDMTLALAYLLALPQVSLTALFADSLSLWLCVCAAGHAWALVPQIMVFHNYFSHCSQKRAVLKDKTI